MRNFVTNKYPAHMWYFKLSYFSLNFMFLVLHNNQVAFWGLMKLISKLCAQFFVVLPCVFIALAVKKNYRFIFSVGKSKPRCEFCNKVFMNQYSLLLHRKVHTGDNPFECLFCEKTYRRKSDLKTHVRKKHKSELSDWAIVKRAY